jgi:hypothetical protein
MMIDEQSLDSERIEVAAWRDMLAAMPAEFALGIGNGSRMIGSVLAISAKHVPLVTFNRGIGMGLEGAPDRNEVRQIAEHVRGYSIPTAQIQIAPQMLTPQLERDLAAEGFERLSARWAKMGRATVNPPKFETGLDIEEVGPDKADIFAGAIQAGFGMPPIFKAWISTLVGRAGWRCYVARERGEVMAGAALFLDADAAWLGMAATLPTARKHGAQSALIARRIVDAGNAGKRWVYTETGILDGPNPSLANMYRTGFQCLHERTNWVLHAN